MSVAVVPAADMHRAAWLAMRGALWPDAGHDDLVAGIEAILAEPRRHRAWLARDALAGEIGLAEASLRHDYVNGCDTTPVAFLEALYVAPSHRRCGIARALNDVVSAWGRTAGAREYASDAPLGNAASHAVHGALGFRETERVVCFRQVLAP